MKQNKTFIKTIYNKYHGEGIPSEKENSHVKPILTTLWEGVYTKG